LLSKLVKVIAAPAAIIGVLAVPAVASAAPHATVKAVTHLTNYLDYGYSGPWAGDNLQRTATVTLLGTAPVSSCGGSPVAACYQYTGRISDTGTARAFTGAFSPGAQAVKITGTPTAEVNGHAVVNFFASSNAPTGALVPKTLSGYSSHADANWVQQFFPSTTKFSSINFTLATYTWTYVDRKNCQIWVKAYNVSQPNSGDITGVSYCTHPSPHGWVKLTGGRSSSVSPTRENYSWVQNRPSWDKLTIVGPGPINGHVGYVNAMHPGRVYAYYTGLESKHTYVVTIQPQFTPGGAPAGPSGRVTFVTR
jgi:hypothetical protein